MDQPIVINRELLARLMGLDDYVAAVEAAFRAHAEGRTSQPSRRPGRIDDKEVTIFDSTGLAIQDVASAAAAHARFIAIIR